MDLWGLHRAKSSRQKLKPGIMLSYSEKNVNAKRLPKKN